MDIVTHAMMGTVLAGPFTVSSPAAASCFLMGSVLPDLDAVCRVFGKRTFLRCHQTWTHALPVIAGISAAAWAGLWFAGVGAAWPAGALALGMAVHSLLDVSNTYGITLFAPFSRKRVCTDWVFFIDAVMLAATAAAFASVVWALVKSRPWISLVAGAYLCFLVVYWLIKILLRRRAVRRTPKGTVSLVPSALVPWAFLGYGRAGGEAFTFRLNALNGRVAQEEKHSLLDDDYAEALNALPEFRVMHGLSHAYHVTGAELREDGAVVTCRDLRIRNFGGRFGELTVHCPEGGDPEVMKFHV